MAVTLNRDTHEPTAKCYGVHCHIHHVDEDDKGAYRWCLECGHVYRTAGALRRAFRREYWAFASNQPERALIPEEAWFDPLYLRIWRVLTVRASKISFCQHCLHDF